MMLFKDMRKFHNQIKLRYLDEYVTEPSRLLDLASGKGGDIFKWNSNKNILLVDGYDINGESVREAIRRRNAARIKKRMTFQILDLGKNALSCEDKYDVITSMFAFHYFFKSKSTLDTIFKTLRNCSKQGTTVILTLFDGDRLESVNSKNFYIKLDKDNDKRRVTGNKLDVFIRESVLDKPETEYLVQPKFLISLMKKNGFKLIEKTDFESLYKTHTGLTKLNEEERKLSFMNTVYVFQKKIKPS